MAPRPLIFEMVFRADARQAVAASKDVKEAVDAATAETTAATTAAKSHKDALDKETAATRDAAKAQRDLAQAERDAREAARRAVVGPGVLPAVGPVPTSGRPFAPQSSPAGPSQPSPSPADLEEARARFGPEYRVQRDYDRAVTDLRRASPHLSQDEEAAALKRLTDVRERDLEMIRRSTAAGRDSAGVIRLQAHEQRNLMFQLNDTFQTIALGMPISQVALQQGPQIVQIYGGVGNTLRAALQVLTPIRVGLGLTTAALVIGATSWNGYLRSIKEVETAASGLGRSMARPPAELEAAARAGAAAAGISIKDARSMQAAFLRTGKIGADSFEQLIGMSKDWGATIGITASEAGSNLAEMMADPGRAADTLFRQYGLISAETARYAQDLSAQNRATDAQTVLLEALNGKLADSREATTALGSAWAWAGRQASNAGDLIGGAIDRAVSGPDADTRIAELEEDLAGSRLNRLGRAAAEAELANIRRQQAAQREREEAQARQQADNRATALALPIAEGSPANARANRERQLRNEIATLEDAQGRSGLSAEQEASITAALNAKTNALTTLTGAQERQNTIDTLSIRIANETNPLLRANFEAHRTRLELADQELSFSQVETRAQQARNRVMAETIAQTKSQSADLATELEVRGRLDRQVAQGVITSTDAARLLREELELRPLVAAAAAAQGEEQAELNRIIAERRDLYTQMATADRARDQDRIGSQMVRNQQEELERLRVQRQVISLPEAERQRILAAAEAEAEIRRQKLDPSSARAREIRSNAPTIADERREVDRLADAWGRVQQAAEGAIDGPIDALLKGDLSGAFDSVASEITGLFTELAIKNPLKNGLLGTDYATTEDVGGLRGIFDRLTGRQETGAVSLSTMSAASMEVSTPSVIINASSLSFQGAGGLPGIGMGVGGAPGTEAVQGQIWQYFLEKGLAPHQVAGIVGNASAESSFNPLAVGDQGTSFGLFQHHNERAQGLLASLGGKENLGDIKGQLDYVWTELMTTERGTLERLRNAPDVRTATAAWAGFERPQGYSSSAPENSHNWAGRLGAAEQALTDFQATTSVATQGLGSLGKGFDIFGSALGQAAAGGGGGGGGGGDFMGAIVSGIAGSLGIPGFSAGGNHRGGLRVVGEKGPELEYTGPSTILPADLTRQIFSTRSSPIHQQSGHSAAAAPVSLQVINQSSAPVQGQVEETTGPNGERQLRMVMSDVVAQAITAPGGKSQKVLKDRYQLKQKVIPR